MPILFAIVLFMTYCLAPLYAQSKKEKEVNLDEVTVTASQKKAEAAIGAKVTSIKQEDLKTNLTKSLSEILWRVAPYRLKVWGKEQWQQPHFVALPLRIRRLGGMEFK